MNSLVILLILCSLALISAFRAPVSLRMPSLSSKSGLFAKKAAEGVKKEKTAKVVDENKEPNLGIGNLVDSIAMTTGYPKKDIRNVMDEFINIVRDEVFTKEREMRLQGFGTFKATHRNARKGFDIQSRKSIDLPARKVLTFKSSKDLRTDA
jgi:DNA-binding protein HU-beta